MHKISKKHIQDLANQLAAAALNEDTSLLLEKARELYENATLLHHFSTDKTATEITQPIVVDEKIESEISEEKPPNAHENILTVKERIQQIMDTAPIFKSHEEAEQPTERETIKKDFITENEDEKKLLPKTSLEDEFKDAISADYAADLFENAEKIEITKKSLNDTLSQKEIQIGLNDRIAFVKHLFNGSQADFTRVLSQLNSFETEFNAKHFMNSVVKPDYNWKEKIEYEERLLALIERKFL